MLTSTVYTVASSDSCGLNTKIFITYRQPIPGLPRTPRGRVTTLGPSCLQLVDQSAFAAFWDLLTQSTDDNGYAIQSHTLELQPNFALI